MSNTKLDHFIIKPICYLNRHLQPMQIVHSMMPATLMEANAMLLPILLTTYRIYNTYKLIKLFI